MKKLTYLVIATAALGMVACTGGNKAGYVVTGTVEGASDGDTVYLQEATGRNLTKLDTAVITKGTFTFEGTQDSVVSRYVTCEVNGEPLMIDFFLENGKINVALTKDNDAVTGTPNNDAYQEIRAQINDISKKMNTIYEAMGDTSLSDEQKEAKQKEGAQLEEQYDKVIKEGVKKNIANPVGVFLFKQTFYNNSTDENEALLQQIPANFQNDETIVRIKEMTASLSCNVAPGSSTGQAIQEVEALFKEQLGDEFGYEWTSVAYQETQAGNTTTIVLVMALIVAFLVLAAQYESWTSPVAAVIGLPVALLGAMIGCLIMGTPVSIYTQIGIILLVALSAKNGILIVEFARDFRAEGNSIREAAFEAGHVRLRPILMTSFAFVLGVMPLLFATGAGAQSRIALGAAVVFGMAMNTLLATIYIPNFYELMQKLQERFSKKKADDGSGKDAATQK